MPMGSQTLARSGTGRRLRAAFSELILRPETMGQGPSL